MKFTGSSGNPPRFYECQNSLFADKKVHISISTSFQPVIFQGSKEWINISEQEIGI
jgi:hypothetical protein